MKAKSIFWMICITLFLGELPVTAQNKPDKKEKEEAVKKQIESGSYKIEVSTAYPRRGRNVPLTSSYSLEIRDDSVFSYLPFYGRAYSIPYGGGDGMNFKAPIEEYRAKFNSRKKKYEVKLKTRTNEDTFRYSLDIFTNGSTSINVNMQNRESMSYSGEIDLLPL